MSFMTKNSINHEAAGEPYMTLSGPNVLGLRNAAKAHGVEWHHAAGHSEGRQIIAFFPQDDEERRAIDRLSDAVAEAAKTAKAEKAKLKTAGLPTSKAALWRHLEEFGGKDKGHGHVGYLDGKYGPFVPSFGEPDGRYYFDSPELATVAKRLLKL